MMNSTLRYQFPKKSVKGNCPNCGHKYLRTLSRYVDTQSGEPLPEPYGRCDRESKCSYHLSPYQKDASGVSFANRMYEYCKAEQPFISSSSTSTRISTEVLFPIRYSKTFPDLMVHCLPDELFKATLGYYERNAFAVILQQYFGQSIATNLIERFGIGTSSYWPGACVFWLRDEQNRVRGGQVVLFNKSGHTTSKLLHNGQTKRYTSWVHSALASRYDHRRLPRPDWLELYINKANKFPIPFGLHQLHMSTTERPIALVESPKTAVICTAYFSEFVWMAIGSLSYLNAERLTPLRMYKLVLFPDLNAYHDRYTERGQLIRGWLRKAEELRSQGFILAVSDYLESRATDVEKVAGLDLADYLLEQWKGYPPDWD